MSENDNGMYFGEFFPLKPDQLPLDLKRWKPIVSGHMHVPKTGPRCQHGLEGIVLHAARENEGLYEDRGRPSGCQDDEM